MWTIEKGDQTALAAPGVAAFESDVIAHVRRKLVLQPPVDEAAVTADIEQAYARARGLLALYDEGAPRHRFGLGAGYDTHVRLTLLWAVLGKSNMGQTGPSLWLNNDRIGINTRVWLAYTVSLAALKDILREQNGG